MNSQWLFIGVGGTWAIIFALSIFAVGQALAIECRCLCRTKVTRVILYSDGIGVTFSPKHDYCVYDKSTIGNNKKCATTGSTVDAQYGIALSSPVGCDDYLVPWEYSSVGSWSLIEDTNWYTIPERECQSGGTPLCTFYP